MWQPRAKGIRSGISLNIDEPMAMKQKTLYCFMTLRQLLSLVPKEGDQKSTCKDVHHA